MVSFRLRRFWNECGNCGLSFETLVQSQDYEPVVYDNGSGSRRYLAWDQDAVWNEVKRLIAHEGLPPSRYETDDSDLFHAVLARTIDPPPDGEPFGSASDGVPCPRCGSRTRQRFGTVEPPQFVDVQIEPATHYRWNALSADEKKAVVREVIAQVRGPKS